MPQTKTPARRAKASRTKRSRTRRAATGNNGRQRPLIEQSGSYLARNYMRFIKKYPGEYVIALGNRVIAHGTDIHEVRERAALKAGDENMSAILSFIPESLEDDYRI